ncbi:glycosyltransferase family 2 protein [Haloglomus litoreum]|uniref:glycosyltransferase family 2 protein n=1 Tax=Haloglomus litoreum TaxID=3034026 RepID=UPI0023E8273F|nr:glycosyltransferase family 2 protein [Haloglomus sp. DT116]
MASNENGEQVPRVTVLTTTYERADTLARPYESLCEQTFSDFEWLVVDDRSNDGIRELVEGWKQEVPFDVRFVTQPQDRTGRHCALNIGAESARGEFVRLLDSDDSCPPDSLNTLVAEWERIPSARRAEFAGVLGRTQFSDGTPFADPLPESPLDSSPTEIRYQYRLEGDYVGMFRRDVLLKFPFPERQDVRYIPESIVFDRIGREYTVRYINEIIDIYHAGSEDGRLTTIDFRKKATEIRLLKQQQLNDDIEWAGDYPLNFAKLAANYVRLSLHEGRGLRTQAESLDSRLARGYWLAAAPLGIFLYFSDRYWPNNPIISYIKSMYQNYDE